MHPRLALVPGEPAGIGPEIAAVGGRVHVSNPNENWLTRLQTIKYYFGQEHLKNLERGLRQVLCLSGCLTAYRRHVLIQLEPLLEFCRFINRLQQRAGQEPAQQVLPDLLKAIDYEAFLYDHEEERTAQSRWANVCEFAEWLNRKVEEEVNKGGIST